MFKFSHVMYKDILQIESLVIPEKKVTCIVGESGSGKTTLIRLLNKLISPTAGEITYRDQPLSTLNSVEIRRNVVMLSQNPAIYPGTVYDNLQLGLRFSERPTAAEQDLLAALEKVRLPKQLSDNAEKLSGGEKQRLALARVLLMNPDVLLLDEPSSALDEETEQLVIDKVVSHARNRQKTLIMVTHAKQVAQRFGDCIIELKNGRVYRQEGLENA